MRDVVTLIHTDAILHKVNILLQMDPGAPKVYGDKVQLQQVILNLLLNAFQAMKNCPVTERQVTVRTELDTHSAIVAVRDRGEGLKDGQLERFFNLSIRPKLMASVWGSLSVARSSKPTAGGYGRRTIPIAVRR